MKIFIVVILVIEGSFGCQKIFSNTTNNNNRYFYSSRYPSYTQYSNPTSTTTIQNATIVCSNIYSIDEIYYSYSEEDYEQFLKITDSNVTTLRTRDFVEFSTITKLFLSGIHLKEIQPSTFTNLDLLEELYLNKNELTRITENVFLWLDSLKILDLSENKIVQIEESALSGLYALTRLNLQSNSLTKLEDQTFKTVSHLTYLDLSENPLESVPATGLSHLDYLGIANTSVREYNNLKNLTILELNLSSNHLTTADFLMLPNVTNLDLSNNELSLLKNFQNARTLKLNLSNNKFKSINESLIKLTELRLANNNIESIENVCLNRSKSIVTLDLSFNKISSLAVNAFKELSSLEYLFLQNNTIKSLDLKLFIDLTNLRSLDLSHNFIETLQFGVFNNMKKLQDLNLSYNKLTTLTSSLFYPLTNLRILNVEYNQISTFDADNLSVHLQSIRQIAIDGNKMKCKDLIYLDRAMKVKYFSGNLSASDSYHVENFNGIACESDDHLPQNTPNISSKVIVQDLQNVIDETVRNSQLEKFLNEDFEQSNFAKFFKSYNNSKFVEPLEKNESTVEEPVPAGRTSEEREGSGSNGVLIMSVILQIVMCAVLVFMAYFMYSFVKNSRNKIGASAISQVELTEDY